MKDGPPACPHAFSVEWCGREQGAGTGTGIWAVLTDAGNKGSRRPIPIRRVAACM